MMNPEITKKQVKSAGEKKQHGKDCQHANVMVSMSLRWHATKADALQHEVPAMKT